MKELLEEQAMSAGAAALHVTTTTVPNPQLTIFEAAALDDSARNIAAVWPGLSQVKQHATQLQFPFTSWLGGLACITHSGSLQAVHTEVRSLRVQLQGWGCSHLEL